MQGHLAEEDKLKEQPRRGGNHLSTNMFLQKYRDFLGCVGRFVLFFLTCFLSSPGEYYQRVIVLWGACFMVPNSGLQMDVILLTH